MIRVDLMQQGLGFRLPMAGVLKECGADGEERVVGKVYGGEELRIHVPNSATSDVFRVTQIMGGEDGTLIELDDEVAGVEAWVCDDDGTLGEFMRIAEPVDIDHSWCGRDFKYYGGKSRGDVPGISKSELGFIRNRQRLDYELDKAVDNIVHTVSEPAGKEGGERKAAMLREAVSYIEKWIGLLEWGKSKDPAIRKEGELREIRMQIGAASRMGDAKGVYEYTRRYNEILHKPMVCFAAGEGNEA